MLLTGIRLVASLCPRRSDGRTVQQPSVQRTSSPTSRHDTIPPLQNAGADLPVCAGIEGMTSRYVPYASRPGRLMLQLLSDMVVVLWITLWVLIGLAVHSAISEIADFGQQMERGANGVAHNMDSASERADKIPLLGETLSKPLTSTGHAAHSMAGAGHNLYTTATWLAIVLALAVAAPPMLAIVVPWLIRRVRFFRRKRLVLALAATPGGTQLLALRALANRPLRRVAKVDSDPVGAWRREEVAVIHGLAALELRSAGMRVRASAR
jgi:hypothetical protein